MTMSEMIASRTEIAADHGVVSAGHPLEVEAGIAALRGPDEPVQRMNATFRERRDRLVNGLNRIANVSCTMPEGAFYAFPNVSKVTLDDKGLATFMLEEAGVACLGGSSFGKAGKGYLRFSYATSLEQIDLALARIAEHLPRFAG